MVGDLISYYLKTGKSVQDKVDTVITSFYVNVKPGVRGKGLVSNRTKPPDKKERFPTNILNCTLKGPCRLQEKRNPYPRVHLFILGGGCTVSKVEGDLRMSLRDKFSRSHLLLRKRRITCGMVRSTIPDWGSFFQK